MPEEDLNKLKGMVDDNLQKQIASVESVMQALEEDLKSCPPAERERNQKLLDTATKLLNEMKTVRNNINGLIE